MFIIFFFFWFPLFIFIFLFFTAWPTTRHPLPVTRYPPTVTRHPSPVTRGKVLPIEDEQILSSENTADGNSFE